jgi:hypothetical protein
MKNGSKNLDDWETVMDIKVWFIFYHWNAKEKIMFDNKARMLQMQRSEWCL